MIMSTMRGRLKWSESEVGFIEQRIWLGSIEGIVRKDFGELEC
jgi:hypothetical protein